MRRDIRVVGRCVDALVDFVQLAPAHGPPPAELHAAWRRIIDDCIAAAKKQGTPRSDLDALLLPVVALVDEIALADDARREHWLSTGPLQLHYFQENLAGETFFARLEQELAGARREGVLHLHYLCLMLGFRGKHSGDPDALEAVTRSLAFLVKDGAAFPPEHPAPPAVARPTRGILLAPVLLALFSVVFTLVFVARSRCSVDERIRDALSATHEAGR
jgi:type VI secretion system protein ImpK